jgi:hypothetical protein
VPPLLLPVLLLLLLLLLLLPVVSRRRASPVCLACPCLRRGSTRFRRLGSRREDRLLRLDRIGDDGICGAKFSLCHIFFLFALQDVFMCISGMTVIIGRIEAFYLFLF